MSILFHMWDRWMKVNKQSKDGKVRHPWEARNIWVLGSSEHTLEERRAWSGSNRLSRIPNRWVRGARAEDVAVNIHSCRALTEWTDAVSTSPFVFSCLPPCSSLIVPTQPLHRIPRITACLPKMGRSEWLKWRCICIFHSWEAVEFEWSISQGFSSLHILQEIQKDFRCFGSQTFVSDFSAETQAGDIHGWCCTRRPFCGMLFVALQRTSRFLEADVTNGSGCRHSSELRQVHRPRQHADWWRCVCRDVRRDRSYTRDWVCGILVCDYWHRVLEPRIPIVIPTSIVTPTPSDVHTAPAPVIVYVAPASLSSICANSHFSICLANPKFSTFVVEASASWIVGFITVNESAHCTRARLPRSRSSLWKVSRRSIRNVFPSELRSRFRTLLFLKDNSLPKKRPWTRAPRQPAALRLVFPARHKFLFEYMAHAFEPGPPELSALESLQNVIHENRWKSIVASLCSSVRKESCCKSRQEHYFDRNARLSGRFEAYVKTAQRAGIADYGSGSAIRHREEVQVRGESSGGGSDPI